MGATWSKLRSGCSRKAKASRSSSSNIPHELLRTERVREIAVDYGAEVCELLHTTIKKDQEVLLEEIAITFDERGGARWRSRRRFEGGTVSAQIRCPRGDTSGLNCSFYLSSLEGGPRDQLDEIDFEFLGNDKSIVQTNFHAAGSGHREVLHDLAFDTSADFHEYSIRWSPSRIEWLVDGACIRFAEKWYGESFPSKPMFLYASVWNASDIDDGRWAGTYHGRDAPYVCTYKHVCVPHVN